MGASPTRSLRVAAATAMAGTLAAGLAFAPAASGTTIAVTTTVDETSENDLCSLREAVDAANDNSAVEQGGAGPDCPAGSAGTDMLVLGAGTFTLTGADEDANVSGDLDINADAPGPVELVGAGESQTTITGDGADRIVELLDGTLAISDLTITGGMAGTFGGGVYADGNPSAGHLTLTDVTVSGNDAASGGGGVMVSQGGGGGATLELTRATVDGNTAGNSGGGGVAAFGSIAITDSQISSNEAASDLAADGAGLKLGFGTASIAGTTIEDNHAGAPADPQGGQGGGVYFEGGASDELTIAETTISQNTSRSAGGGLAVSGSDASVDLIDTTVTGNGARSGAGLNAFNGSSLSLLRTRVVSNVASTDGSANGGGILVGNVGLDASLDVTNSIVSGNSAEATVAASLASGGGIHATQSTETRILGSEVAGNTATGDPGYGGGISQAGSGSSGLILNSTVQGNTAAGTATPTGGGALVFAGGGTLDLISTSIEGNLATTGTGLTQLGGTITLTNSALDQPANACGAGGVTSGGGNVSSEAPDTCGLGAAGDLTGSDPAFGPLDDNGGPSAGATGSQQPIRSLAILPSSPAFDHVAVADCVDEAMAPLDVDQRGIDRPGPPSTDCDAGAYEYADSDGDGTEEGVDPWPLDADDDADGDGVSGHVDNCPAAANPGQQDSDSDGAGDACDPFPNDPDNDADGDGVSGHVDNCPGTANGGQTDTDSDGQGDACDADDDGDGTPDGADAFPLDPGEQADGDSDGVGDNADNCPAAANPGQQDSDSDGAGDACDPSDPGGPGDGIEGLKLRASGKKRVKAGRPVKLRVRCPKEDCTVKGRAIYKVPRRGGRGSATVAAKLKLKTKRASKQLEAGERKRLKLKLKRKRARRLKRLTRRGAVRKRTKVVVKLKAKDASGERAKLKKRLKLKR